MNNSITPQLISNCPICLSKNILKKLEINWQIWDQTYSLSQCTNCGCAFTTPFPDDLTLDRFYRTAFDYRWYRDYLAAKLRDSKIRLEEYKNLLGKRVLDFGGGLGYFSQVARQYGFDSITYDPYVDTSAVLEKDWSTLVALHVLEHSNNLDQTFNQIKNLLSPGGHIILAVPNYEGLGYQSLGMRWVWAQPPLLHIFHFTAKGLEKLLRRHGFIDIKISYHERWDANNFCDVKHYLSTHRWDAAWGSRPLNKISIFRKVIAIHNARRRFRGLKTALAGFNKTFNIYSELQITAILADLA